MTKNPVTAGLIVFLVGAIALAIAVVAMRQPLPSVNALIKAPPTIWLGGLIAMVYILATVIITPKLGVGTTAVLIIAGQILIAIVLDHFGAFGTVHIPLNMWRVLGAFLVIGGVICIRMQ